MSLNLIPLKVFGKIVMFSGQFYVASHVILPFAFYYVQIFSTGINPHIKFRSAPPKVQIKIHTETHTHFRDAESTVLIVKLAPPCRFHEPPLLEESKKMEQMLSLFMVQSVSLIDLYTDNIQPFLRNIHSLSAG